ncbi:hypothetical protein [Flavobacterium pectinovorum]|uniref:hypothetical protein n=1 Tax=Flavobacterium pectinovorum TaxID=29533 RepID=UPI001FAD3520|nr:hypothetical protein [Flavobacterium pectinovorum]MCI9844614.1 hypothetical protein [Flavobacterium pectinovorum]
MKTKILFLALVAIGLSSCAVQSQTTVYAKNSDISDNLDLRAVASIFGESANLQDFERRLNDPKYQISNLDLNNDDQVDYLRVIETVEDRTHVVIIQSVLDRDVYQDIATIDIERDNYNKVSVQVVGNSYLYGANYIYEPVYNVTPGIYASFWVTNYRPYYSTWAWNFYPTYYVAWRPFPIYRYRSNINICINVNNRYNYVNHRRSYRAPVLYETRRCYGYERQYPNRSFSQRHSNVNNRYDLEQRRVASREYSRNQNVYNNNRSNSGRFSNSENRNSNRNYAENKKTSDRTFNSNRNVSGRDNNPVRVENTPRYESRGNSNEDRNRSDRNNNSNRVTSGRDNSSTGNNNTVRVENTPKYESRGNSNEDRMNNNRSVSSQRTESPRAESSRNYAQNRSASENRSSSARQQNTQRSESPRMNQESRGGGQSQRENASGTRGGGRRG